MINTVDTSAPGFAKSVIARRINSLLDLECTFGLIGRDISTAPCRWTSSSLPAWPCRLSLTP
jgi:hypothetical protein